VVGVFADCEVSEPEGERTSQSAAQKSEAHNEHGVTCDTALTATVPTFPNVGISVDPRPDLQPAALAQSASGMYRSR
jgi:hypothetical protein